MIAPRVGDTDALLTVSVEAGFLERKMEACIRCSHGPPWFLLNPG